MATKVKFVLEKDGAMIVYPDTRSLFRGAEIVEIDGTDYVVAEYSGELELTEYVEEAETEDVILTHLAFRRLLTFAERVAIDNYASNTSLTDEQVQQMKTIEMDFKMANEINLSDEDTIAYVNLLETIGFLAEGRAAEVLAYTQM